MNMQSSFLTLSVDNQAVLPSDNAESTNQVTTEVQGDAAAQTGGDTAAQVGAQTNDATAAQGTDTAGTQATTDVTDENGNVNLDGFTEISTDENGNMVLVNPETGETANPADYGIDLSQATSSTGTAPIVQKDLTGAVTGIYVVYAIFCIGLVALILSQKKRSAAFGNGMGSSVQTYWDKNKGRSKEGKLDLYTKWGIAIFIVFTFIITLI